jgi:hypothetical protein
MTSGQLREIFDRTKGRCHFCGDKLTFDNVGWAPKMKGHWEADHVIQHAKGGRSAAGNYLAACTRCNRLRWHRTGHGLREVLLLGLIAQGEIQKANSHVGRSLQSLRRLRVDKNAVRRMKRALEQQLKAGGITQDQLTRRVADLRRGESQLTKLEHQWLRGDLSYGRLVGNKAKTRREMGMTQPTQTDIIPPSKTASASKTSRPASRSLPSP